MSSLWRVDRTDEKLGSVWVGEGLAENGVFVINLSRTIKELFMKIVKASLIAFSVATAGSVFAQAAGPDTNTLKLCDDQKYSCDLRESFKKDDVLHRLTKKDWFREIFVVNSRPVPVTATKIYIVKEEKAEQVSRPVITQNYYEVIPMTPEKSNNWAYVPK
jgi:hypothetical protein